MNRRDQIHLHKHQQTKNLSNSKNNNIKLFRRTQIRKNLKIHLQKGLKQGPWKLLAVANNSGLQLGMIVPLKPHEISNGIVLRKLLRGAIVNLGENLESWKPKACGCGSRWKRACQFWGC